MAEGGFESSIHDSSDVFIAFTCTPCSKDGTRVEAVKYCPECDEYLCKTCSKCHQRMKATYKHQLVDTEEGNERSKFTKENQKIKCRHHPDREIEMYCGSHDMVYCSMCIATNHRPCCGVSSLTDAIDTLFQPNDIARLQTESASMRTLLEETQNKKTQNIALIQKKRETIERKIQKVEENIMKHMKDLTKQANETLQETYTNIEGKLESEIDMMKKTRSEVDKVDGELMSMLEANREHQFVKVKLCQEIIKHAKTLHDKCASGGQISIYFHENTNVTGQLLEVPSLCKISGAPFIRRIKRQEDVNVRVRNDKKKCHIFDACSLDNGAIILADFGNCRIKLLDNNLRVTNSYNVEGQPTGICRITDHEIAVKLYTNTIEILSVDTRISKVRSISINRGGEYCGFAYVDGKFWIGTESDADVCDIEGSFEKSISYDFLGHMIRPRQMATLNNTVFVAVVNSGVFCLGSDGLKKTEFRDSKLTKTTGVCLSNDGTVYAFDEESERIIIFSDDGKCLGELVPESPLNNFPVSLCYINKNNSIMIGYESSDTVTVLYLSD